MSGDMVESMVVGLIVAAAFVVSGRHLLREFAVGKRKCSGCADDCPLASSCAAGRDAARVTLPARASSSARE